MRRLNFYPSLHVVLVQPRKTRPCLTEKLLRDVKNQIKQTQPFECKRQMTQTEKSSA